ncbi:MULTISPECIES: hypothetical protein [unclassified Streptomyces]|uniref:hypothetical protein n=1 Tax=unclassified Streptomyces TaxID=2593676 RepID=UPI002E2906C3|nr:hypothetical protein [Streptomyces sp. NBC_00272]
MWATAPVRPSSPRVRDRAQQRAGDEHRAGAGAFDESPGLGGPQALGIQLVGVPGFAPGIALVFEIPTDAIRAA